MGRMGSTSAPHRSHIFGEITSASRFYVIIVCLKSARALSKRGCPAKPTTLVARPSKGFGRRTAADGERVKQYRRRNSSTEASEDEDTEIRESQGLLPAAEENEEDNEPWINVTSRARRRRLQTRSTAPQLSRTPRKPVLRQSRPAMRKPRQPPLPADDYKLAVRPRNSLQLNKPSSAVLPLEEDRATLLNLQRDRPQRGGLPAPATTPKCRE
ncbi:hypothetical protein HPB49_021278 [Dermacentor silvarum]|uniref:Uncharacterized protein n=1 Tax=Dermacentor silvarum TaxID=543639 RepID=A0ACB8C5J6_DERSI|nr:hypothetical protein HPB49_021278 [Dermacentor silvarum]